MLKTISPITKKEYTLKPAKCLSEPEVVSAEYTDHLINGVVYRVWSAFENEVSAEESIKNLMLRRLESGEKVEEVRDFYTEKIKEIESSCM